MTRLLTVSGAVLCVALTHAQGQMGAPPPASPETFATVDAKKAFVTANCAGCHNSRAKAGDYNWETIDLAQPAKHAEHLEKAILKVRAGLMPPPGPRRPSDATLQAFASSLEQGVDQAAAANPRPGRPELHRMNRAEYANAVRDLLGVEADVSRLLPADEMSRGYANMSDVLKTSASLIEGYVRAASRISRLALGDPKASRAVATYTLPRVVSQIRHIEGTPFGTRGGISVVHNFPVDGEYVFRMSFYYSGLAVLYGEHELQGPQQIEVSIDGEQVALLDIPPRLKLTTDLRTVKIKVKAGPQRVSAAFIQKADGPVDDVVQPPEQSLVDVSNANVPGITALPHLRDLAIDGPHTVLGLTETEARGRIMSCRPKSETEELPCAKAIITRLAREAYRRPVGENDIQGLVRMYRVGRGEKGGFDDGIRAAVQAVLASPEFIFRFERTPAGVAPNATYRIADLDLAARLSFFLWSSNPDDELLKLATASKLRDPQVLEAQVRRMLADPRAEALSAEFASYWLHLQNLKDMRPDSYQYPDFDMNLMTSMTRETQLFFNHIVRENRPHHRTAHRRLHLRRRPAGAPLRPAQRARPPLPQGARSTDERPPRPARSRQRAHAHVLRQPHLAGAARQVGDGRASRDAAGQAAGQHPAAAGEHRRREAPAGARAARGAPQEPGLRRLPPGHGPDRVRARELRRGRPVAHQGQRRAHRRVGHARRRHAGERTGQPARGAAAPLEPVRAQVHPGPADVRPGPGHPAL